MGLDCGDRLQQHSAQLFSALANFLLIALSEVQLPEFPMGCWNSLERQATPLAYQTTSQRLKVLSQEFLIYLEIANE